MMQDLENRARREVRPARSLSITVGTCCCASHFMRAGVLAPGGTELGAVMETWMIMRTGCSVVALAAGAFRVGGKAPLRPALRRRPAIRGTCGSMSLPGFMALRGGLRRNSTDMQEHVPLRF